jgi:MYXO-CTERM domain-containing protein
MKNVRSAITGAAIAILVAVSGEGAARADIPPADACTAPGQPCQNAGPNYDQPGSCVAATCQKGHLEDGGVVYTPYDCHLCRGDGGSGGGGGSAAGGASATGGSGGATTGHGGATATGGSRANPGGSSSGCSLAGGESATPATWLLIGLGGFLARRRKTR